MNEKLTAICWDTDVDPDQLSRLLCGDIEKVGHIDRANLFRRLLTTYDWYTLDDRFFEEIARISRISLSSAKMRVYRGREKLQRVMKQPFR